ncbi:MAG: YqaJ viral recombinase family protein [Planctomycetota bacterium]|nr:YqaJ viral recombinase family protein [Planctomycetota bacterium]
MGTLIAKMTDYNDRDKWLAARPKTLGASDAAAALGLSKYKSPYALWADKTGRGEPVEVTLPMQLGHACEPVIARQYTKETGRELIDFGDYAMFIHPQYPFLTCTPDRVTERTDLPGSPDGAVEMKRICGAVAEEMRDGDAKIEHQIQLAMQMEIMGLNYGEIAALVVGHFGTTFERFPYERDPRSMARIIPALEKFWHYVETDTPPPVDDTQSTLDTLKALHPDDNGETVHVAEDKAGAAQIVILDFTNIKAEIKELESEKRECESTLRNLIGANTFLEVPAAAGFPAAKVSLKSQTRKGSIRIDATDDHEILLRTEEIKFKKTGAKTFRVLRQMKVK